MIMRVKDIAEELGIDAHEITAGDCLSYYERRAGEELPKSPRYIFTINSEESAHDTKINNGDTVEYRISHGLIIQANEL
jgi:hypothetical protein